MGGTGKLHSDISPTSALNFTVLYSSQYYKLSLVECSWLVSWLTFALCQRLLQCKSTINADRYLRLFMKTNMDVMMHSL